MIVKNKFLAAEDISGIEDRKIKYDMFVKTTTTRGNMAV